MLTGKNRIFPPKKWTEVCRVVGGACRVPEQTWKVPNYVVILEHGCDIYSYCLKKLGVYESHRKTHSELQPDETTAAAAATFASPAAAAAAVTFASPASPAVAAATPASPAAATFVAATATEIADAAAAD